MNSAMNPDLLQAFYRMLDMNDSPLRQMPEKANTLICAVTSASNLKLSRATWGLTEADSVYRQSSK